MFQNGPIRKVITKKVIFEDFLIFSPAVGHPGSTLRKILEDFFKKSQVRNSHYLFLLVLVLLILLGLSVLPDAHLHLQQLYIGFTTRGVTSYYDQQNRPIG